MMPVTAAAPKIRINTKYKRVGDFDRRWKDLGLRVCMHPAKGRGIPLFSVE